MVLKFYYRRKDIKCYIEAILNYISREAEDCKIKKTVNTKLNISSRKFPQITKLCFLNFEFYN